jgi:phage-related tail fiber protein
MANTDPTGYLSIPPDLIRGVSWKQPVVCATTANITLSGTQTIDGRAVVAGERVLVKDQTTGSQNGLLVCAAGAWVRAFDMDQDLGTAVPAEEVMGAVVYVIDGTTNGGTTWRCTNTTTPTIGTTALTFAAFGSSGSSAIQRTFAFFGA